MWCSAARCCSVPALPGPPSRPGARSPAARSRASRSRRTRPRRPPATGRASGSSTFSKRIGSPYWTVTFGNCSFFQLRTFAVPAIAVGTMDAPVSSASRPTPGFGSPSRSVRERPPSMYITITPPRREHGARGLERLLVAPAAQHREHAAVRVDELQRRLEELRLRHEVHLAPDERRDEEVIEEREVVRHDDRRPLGGDLVGVDHPRAVEEQEVRREHDPDELVHPVGGPCARARGSA